MSCQLVATIKGAKLSRKFGQDAGVERAVEVTLLAILAPGDEGNAVMSSLTSLSEAPEVEVWIRPKGEDVVA